MQMHYSVTLRNLSKRKWTWH